MPDTPLPVNASRQFDASGASMFLESMTPEQRKATILRLYCCGELSMRETQALFAHDPTLRGA
jgi:hypothetical protein